MRAAGRCIRVYGDPTLTNDSVAGVTHFQRDRKTVYAAPSQPATQQDNRAQARATP